MGKNCMNQKPLLYEKVKFKTLISKIKASKEMSSRDNISQFSRK